MSEHEGFCLPLVESMHFGIPIIAYNSTAVPYTLGNSGLLFDKKNYAEVAELIDYAVKNRENIIKLQKERLKDFDREKIKDEFLKIIKSITN